MEVYFKELTTTQHKIISRYTLECACCERKLVDIIVTKLHEKDPIKKYQVKCPCGEQSFVKEIRGHVSFCPVDNLKITQISGQMFKNSNDIIILEVT